MKYCVKCGATNADSARFCTECGATLTTAETENTFATTYTYGESNAHHDIGQRNILLAVILSFVTCGIYQIYWMIKMNDEVNILANEPDATSGVKVFLFTLITCGIYGLFWMYKMGERCDKIKGAVNGNSAVLYLILALLGLGIVSYFLIQDTINKAV